MATNQTRLSSGGFTLHEFKEDVKKQALATHYERLPPPADTDISRSIRFGSSFDGVAEIQQLMRKNIFDHKSYNVFLESVFGQALLDGLCEPEVNPDGKVSVFIREKNTYLNARKLSKLEELGFIGRQPITEKDRFKRVHTQSTAFTKKCTNFINQSNYYRSPAKMMSFYRSQVPSLVD